MKTDAIILGGELDGLLAAARLAQRGYSVQLLGFGGGGLHFAPAGLHLLGYSGDGDEEVPDLQAGIAALGGEHPYRKLGARVLDRALSWYGELCVSIGLPIELLDHNAHAVTPAGLAIPVAGVTPHLATFEACSGRRVAIVEFAGMRDFPASLLCAQLKHRGILAEIVEAPLPERLSENAALAKSFDRLADSKAYFSPLRARLPSEAEVVLFPAVLGLQKHAAICAAAEQALGLPCFEVATLPISVPGLRQELALRRWLEMAGVETIGNFEFRAAETAPDGVEITDTRGRIFRARVAIVATGGALTGGLEVQSDGTVREPLFDLRVWQTAPLSASSVNDTLDALHRTGVEVTATLNPLQADGRVVQSLFVTGQTLAHCNPAAEGSADGIAVVTGWAAAERAGDYLEVPNHG